MKFVVAIENDDARVVEAYDIVEAIYKCNDSCYGTELIVSVTRVPSD